MITTEKKDINEILNCLQGKKNVAVLGCADCATTCATGGEKQVEEMKEILTAEGFNAVFTEVVDIPCDSRIVKLLKRKMPDNVEAAVVLSCGVGVQTVAEEFSFPSVSALNSLFIGQTRRLGNFYEYCSVCGNCMLNETFGICPVTRCSKSLINGPCGGEIKGKCGSDIDKDCIWKLIYDKAKNSGISPLEFNAELRKPLKKNLKPGIIKK